MAGQSLKGMGGGFHQQAVDFFGMGTSQWTQGRRQGEGHQEIGTGQKAAALPNKPALGLILVTLRAGAIAAGEEGKNVFPAGIGLGDQGSQKTAKADGQ